MTAAILSPRAQLEQRRAALWIAKDSPASARRFAQAVKDLASRIGDFPESGTKRPDLAAAPFRFALIRGFPYLAVYNAERSPPLIVRIVHGARDLPAVLRDLAERS